MSSAGCGGWDPAERKLVLGQKEENLNWWEEAGKKEVELGWTGSLEESSFHRWRRRRLPRRGWTRLNWVELGWTGLNWVTERIFRPQVFLGKCTLHSETSTWLKFCNFCTKVKYTLQVIWEPDFQKSVGNDWTRSRHQPTCMSLVLNSYTIKHVLIRLNKTVLWVVTLEISGYYFTRYWPDFVCTLELFIYILYICLHVVRSTLRLCLSEDRWRSTWTPGGLKMIVSSSRSLLVVVKQIHHRYQQQITTHFQFCTCIQLQIYFYYGILRHHLP